ncbi:MAG: hypothetical protein U5K54_27945 [Cytophagales bacterium]|nr:hypothetical protein [Cytophagales bacterium]
MKLPHQSTMVVLLFSTIITIPNLDNYKTGSLTFPLDGLEKGKHTLTLSASDTYNNRAIGTVDFVVTEGDRRFN